MPAYETIFVGIASYRDAECHPTVLDLFAKAAHPERINVGVVMQSMPEDDFAFYHDRTLIDHVDARDSKGACWARQRVASLWHYETYVLQIDSHMRFAQNWDVLLVEQLARCPSPKPMLTTYPPGYELPDHLILSDPIFLAPKQFEADGALPQQGIPRPAKSAIPEPSALIAAGYLFGKSAWIHDVPYDPEIYFQGEETSMAVRLWTHGWDLFGPTENLIWHRYGNDGRQVHWSDHADWFKLDAVSKQRVRQLLGMEAVTVTLAPYDLGTARSLAQYVAFSGIDFQHRTVTEPASNGEFSIPR
jgi:hypothetical protein